MLQNLAEVTRNPYTNSSQSQIPLALAACIRSKESLPISLAKEGNLELILPVRSIDQHQKQNNEILEPPYLSHP